MPKGNNRYDTEHLRNISAYQRQIDEIFRVAVEEAARIVKASGAEYDPDRPFSFDDYPSVKKRVDKMTSDLASRVERTIVNGIKAQWELSNRKNDELVETVTGLKADDLPDTLRRRWFGTNESARKAFTERAREGMNLSEEVWRFRRETELGIDLSLKSLQDRMERGLSEGVSAADMSRELRGYLKNPDKLFRRVRDERGNLTLSRNARLFHPGQGVYRSSYMNARRLAATETNMAYRSADHERWKSLDFVVGIEIQTSNNHTTKDSKGGTKPLEDICDTLAGRYPKDFKFVGWHPHCRCIATPILKTEEEMEADTERIMNGEEPLPPSSSANYEGDLPEKFTKWLDKNSERIENAKSLPYFLKDNWKLIEEGGAKATASTTATPTTQTEQQTQRGVDYTQENAAIEEYVGGEGMWVNQYLRGRGDFGQLSEEEMKLIDELTDITSRETVGVQTLYRSVNADAIFGDMSDFSYEYLKEHYIYGVDNPVIMQKIQRYLGVEGKQLTEKGFMSTSRDREIVENWGDYTGSEHPVVMVIRTDGTTTGFDVGRYTKLHHPEIEADDPQAEILLSRGQRYEVGKVYGKDGNIVVEVRLLPEKNAVTETAVSSPKYRGHSSSHKESEDYGNAKISKMSDISDLLEENGVEYIEPKKLSKPITEDEIVSKVGDYDKTEGECVSQALAYVGNKTGYDVVDNKGGRSLNILAEMDNTIAKTAGGIIRENKNEIELANELLSYVKDGKEYVLSVGDHYAVVRKTKENTLEYLDLQQEKESNGFFPIKDEVLERRFDCRTYKDKRMGSLTDTKSLQDNPAFLRLLGYLNTKR